MRHPCDHAQAVPVESAVTGEVLAALCPGCDTRLPARFLTCDHPSSVDVSSLGDLPGSHELCLSCGVTRSTITAGDL